MAFPRKLLNENEEIVLDLHPHWWSFAPQLAALVVSIGLGLVALVAPWHPALQIVLGVAVLASLVWFGTTYLGWVSTHFVVTTDRLIYRSGVLTKRGVEIPLERVNTVLFSQSLLERMLGMGDLEIESAGAQGLQKFHNVRKPALLQSEIHRQMEANEGRRLDRIRGPQPEPAGPAPSIPEQLEQLDALRRRGVISEDEFQAKKAQLLDRM